MAPATVFSQRPIAGLDPAAAVDTVVDTGRSVRHQLANLMRESLAITVPNLEGIEPQVTTCGNPKNGDYQW